MANVANLHVKIGADIAGLQKSLQNASNSLEAFGKQATRIGSTMTRALTVPIVGGFTMAVKSASDAQETFAKFGTIFRDVEVDAENAFQTLRREYGLSSKASKELLGNTGDLLTGFGFAQTEALRLSTEVNKLAVDLASFTNFSGGAAGASQALTKALLGERESVKSLGISILEEDVKKQVAINTANGLTFATERQAKAQATLDIAIRQSQNAIGDYERTQDSFANQLRLVRARIDDLSVAIGTELLPIAQRLLGFNKNLIDGFNELDREILKVNIKYAALVAAAGPAILAIGKITLAVRALTIAMIANPLGAFIKLVVTLGAVAQVTGSYVRDMAKAQLASAKAMGVANGTAERSVLLQTRIRDLAQELATGDRGAVRNEQIRTELAELSAQLTENEAMLRANIDATNANATATGDSAQAYGTLSEGIEITSNQIEALINSTTALTTEQLNELASLVALNRSLQSQIDLRLKLANLKASGVDTGIQSIDVEGFARNTDRATVAFIKLGTTAPNMLSKVGDSLDAIKAKSDDFTTSAINMGEALQSSVTTAITSFATALGDAFSGDAGAKGFFDKMLRIVVEFASQFGKIMIALGAAKAAIKFSVDPLTTIAAGIALVALSAAAISHLNNGTATSVNDALITSSGDVIKFHPDDNILAMKDFGNLQPSPVAVNTNSMDESMLMKAFSSISWELRGDKLYTVSQRGGLRYER